MSVIAILFVDQKCSKKASISIHVINLGVWDLNWESVVCSKWEHPAMILRIVLAQVANNASQTFQNFVLVYVGVMTHLKCGTIIVEHLAVNEIVSSPLHLYKTRFWVVLDAAFFVLHCPVSNGPKSWERKKNLMSLIFLQEQKLSAYISQTA